MTGVYDELAARLRGGLPDLSFSSFPDGSVDSFCTVRDGDDRVEERSRFAAAVDAALAATSDGVVRVPNLSTGTIASATGGDRFGAGLALARSVGWEWPMSLALGNVCASYYVGTAESGGAKELADHATNGERR